MRASVTSVGNVVRYWVVFVVGCLSGPVIRLTC